MSHPSNIVYPTGPDDAHALDGISERACTGDLDVRCPVCAGYGQWNRQIDIVSHRSIRHICPKCDGRGWIETGADMVPSPDITLSPDGQPQWTTRFDPSDDVE